MTSNFQEGLEDTPARTRSEKQLNDVGDKGGIFVEAVRLTRMPMIVTDATLPGNPIIFANPAFQTLSGYELEELAGQDPHFMNGPDTDPTTVATYESAMAQRLAINIEIAQHRKDGEPFRAMLFAGPIDDGQGTVLHHFLSYLDVTRRYDAEEALALLTEQFEARVAARTAQLQSAMAALQALVHEKELLLAEVNHRAKNSLTIAAALLGIQGGRQSKEEVRALFVEAQDRLMAMARVHDLLSKSDALQQVKLCTYLGDLCDALRPITQRDDPITLSLECEETILLDPNRAIPLGIIATELITNAVKYAFPEGQRGAIVMAARMVSETQIAFSVKDNGVGMSAPREGSLGFSLVETLVRQLRGQMRAEQSSGVAATIVF